MASSTGVPERLPGAQETGLADRETEPLLGRPGDAAQVEGKSSLNNLVMGTGLIGQLGVWLLFVLSGPACSPSPSLLA